MRKFFLALTCCRYRCPPEPSPSSGAVHRKSRRLARAMQRFCGLVIDQGDFTVLACLQQHRPKLTKACDQVLGQIRDDVLKASEDGEVA